MSVCTTPGLYVLQLIPYCPSSAAAHWFKPRTANLLCLLVRGVGVEDLRGRVHRELREAVQTSDG